MLFRKRFFVCSVCGYDWLSGSLYNEEGVPDVNLICPCCGFQTGYDDDELGYTVESYRREWLEDGVKCSPRNRNLRNGTYMSN